MRVISLACFLMFAVSAAQGARILGLFGVSGKSHNNFFSALTLELANRGHNLTILTSFPTKKSSANYREISVDVMEKFSANFSPFKHVSEGMLNQLGSMLSMFLQLCPSVLSSPQVKPLLNEEFDLVIISTFFNQCFLPFGQFNNAPMIGISPAGSLGMGMDMANPEPPSYVPSLFLPLTSKMTFPERLLNTVMTGLIKFLAKYYLKPSMHESAKQFFGPNIPSIEEMERSLSLVIYNNHFSLNSPRPMVPGCVDAGGMHIKQNKEPLPKDLQEYMDGAKDGVIYFSMGSVIQGSEFPKEKLQVILDAFKELPQRIIFKWETENMPGKPSNVKIGKWLPQQAILAHPNLKAFITHGGLLSTQEATYHGVPLVGIPFFGDQKLNIAKSSRLGYAVGLDFQTLDKQSVLAAIKTVTGFPSFSKKAKELSKVVRDQPETPLERAVFWTEYVLRHDGAPHLRTAATNMSWCQVHLIDVYGSIIGVLLVVALFDYYLIKWCCCRKKRSSTSKAGTSMSSKKDKKGKAKAE
ncbi:UDP-glucosyltransferase 2-like [Neocloeon triangulifer]|uniref:UDP-glucosyltransferase 2-like n=1 Tax=Neocloeon triangulifer TaxID=2078957 RepID=UPI00286F907D|nr:UDP-glucosyltransferase 2-like [Neocloeon triangulifer]